jgi:serine/threonine-protein kinase RsbW
MQILNYRIEADIPFDAISIERILVLCEEAIHSITTNEKAKFKLKSAINELLVNALEHGYKKQHGKVSITINKEPQSITIEISDEGSGINFNKIDLNRNISELDSATERGWGLSIINKLSENMQVLPNNPKGTIVRLSIPVQSP